MDLINLHSNLFILILGVTYLDKIKESDLHSNLFILILLCSFNICRISFVNLHSNLFILIPVTVCRLMLIPQFTF